MFLFRLWLAVLIGIFLASWPEQWGLWLAWLLVLFCSKELVIVLGGALLGLLMGSGLLWPRFPPNVGDTDHFQLRIESASLNHAIARVLNVERLKVRVSGNFKAGDQLEIKGGLKPRQTFEERIWWPAERKQDLQNMRGSLHIKDVLGPVRNVPTWGERIRNWVFENLKSTDDVLEGFRRAVFIGDSGSLPRSVWEPMNFFGLSHLLVISGSHFSILLGFFALVLWGPRRLSWIHFSSERVLLIVLSSALFFICEKEISIIRAFVSFIIVFLGGLLWPALHRYPRSEQLSLLGVGLALIFPSVAFEPGYILSFGLTWILLRMTELKNMLNRGLRWLCPYVFLLCLTLVMGLRCSVFTPLANFLGLPIFLFLLVPLAFVSIPLSFLETTVAWAVKKFFSVLCALHGPLQQWDLLATTGRTRGFVVLILLLFSVASISWNGKDRFALLTLGVVLLLFPMGLLQTQNTESSLEIYDVGQGDSLRLNLGAKNMLLDGGNNGRTFRNMQDELLRHPADIWTLSHFDQDHVGAALRLFKTEKAAELWIPRWDGSRIGHDLRRRALRVQLGIHNPVFCESNFCIEGWVDPSRKRSNLVKNNDSLVLALSERESNRLRGLFLGDLPKSGEKRLIRWIVQRGFRLKDGVDILKISHHGSRTGTSAELIELLHPTIALILCGRANTYGHPDSSVLETLERWGVGVLRTDAIGNFKVRFDF